MSAVFAAASLPCRAELACTKVAVEASVEAGQGELTLADLLAQDTCLRLRQAAAGVSLGRAPRAGSVRVLDGRRVRLLLEGLAENLGNSLTNSWANNPASTLASRDGQEAVTMQIPQRIVVERTGAAKSCAEIAAIIASGAPAGEMASAPRGWREDLDCAAVRGIPQAAPLELTRTAWSASRSRWEFALRCVRAEDCIPFLVSVSKDKEVPDAPGKNAGRGTFPPESSVRAGAKVGVNRTELLVKAGQTAMLTWDQGGIRIVLPVTCLDAGGFGEFVRVRFKNTAQTLRAEVVGKGSLRASL